MKRSFIHACSCPFACRVPLHCASFEITIPVLLLGHHQLLPKRPTISFFQIPLLNRFVCCPHQIRFAITSSLHLSFLVRVPTSCSDPTQNSTCVRLRLVETPGPPSFPRLKGARLGSIEPLDDGRSSAERSFDAMHNSCLISTLMNDDDGGGGCANCRAITAARDGCASGWHVLSCARCNCATTREP
ncbi:hypothetical protein K505DRAFT_153935 [Melanomma pulvis-pyrius CBS 109.77]|uniref:Uncharacterized protein n=1 Tax=Melanomma pulvis-pyrius CBS 109.77 TaxID=1314802 RepID=A0A6A6XKK6_9PLEO|nr:hypothetical protein K505DRAFT_153935 [Melanomma pulvis-pyrius CBS 109.77]